ncbi:MAG: acyl-CoA dehydrogenase [Streptosporangiales bacterium]|nr:acyl-CoA dehydrogenase [Streptosporangiales bacterium]
MSIAATAEQQALRAAIRDWAARTGTLASVRAREPSPDAPSAPPATRQWKDLAGLGVFAIGRPDEAGGAGGTVADLAAALDELTVALAPGPVLPSVLAGLALAADSGAREFLAALAEGAATATTAVHPGGLTGTWTADGDLVVSGETGPALSGGPEAHLLAAAATGDGDAWFFIPPGHPGVTVTDRAPVDFSRPLATIRFTHAVIKSTQILKSRYPRDLRDSEVTQKAPASGLNPADLAAALFSAEAAAVARWCCDTAAAYAKTRRQFARPIGSFQAIKHLCATMLCRAQEAAALAGDAARAADEALDGGSREEFSLAAAAAAGKSLDAAVDNAKDCVQVLGGIGFTWEHDAHLYLRRALALRHLLGGGAAWRERTAELALGGARRHLSLDITGPAAESARAVAAKVSDLPEPERRTALANEGYVAPYWPSPHGIGASPGDVLAIDEEFAKAGVPRPDLVIGGWAGQAIVQYGTREQAERFLGPTVRGEVTWCQLFSEPEAGSDLASLRTKATRADGGWVLNGQKVWTSLAHEADWAICIARTDPDVPKHKGLTFFLVDMGSEGLDIRPLREMTGRALFNEVFLDDVFVPDDRVLGQPGEGWRVTRATLAAERVAMSQGSSFGDEVEGLLALARAAGLASDRRALEKIGGLVSGALGGSLLDYQTALARLSGTDGGDSAAVRKILGVGHRQAVAETALELCGAEGAAADGIAADPVYEFLLTRCLSIAGGTSQILLTVVAERVLGLPREEAR